MLLITKLFALCLCSVASSFIVELVFLHTGLRFYIFNVSRFYGSIPKCYNNDKFVIFRGGNFLSSTKLKFHGSAFFRFLASIISRLALNEIFKIVS